MPRGRALDKGLSIRFSSHTLPMPEERGPVSVLGVMTYQDGVLSALAPLGLAASVQTALMVDLDPSGPPYPGDTTLARLVTDGPTTRDLQPSRTGLAVLRNGGVAYSEAEQIIDALGDGWPFVVLRLAPEDQTRLFVPIVPVIPLFPGLLSVPWSRPAVFQDTGFRVRPAAPGPVLPRPSRRTVGGLLEGRVDPRSRWIKAWQGVWELPWT